MEAEGYLAAKNEKGVITVTCKSRSDQMTIHGSSLDISAEQEDVNTFYVVAPGEGKEGIIALTVSGSRGKEEFDIDFVLPVIHPEEKGKEPYIELEKIWVPPLPNRLPRIGKDCYFAKHIFSVKIGGIIYTTDKHTAENDPKYRYVPDGNLLCKYIMGEVDAIEVRQRSAKYAEEVSMKKIVNRVTQDYLDLQKRHKDLAEKSRKCALWGFSWKEVAKKLLETSQSKWLGRKSRIKAVQLPAEYHG